MQAENGAASLQPLPSAPDRPQQTTPALAASFQCHHQRAAAVARTGGVAALKRARTREVLRHWRRGLGQQLVPQGKTLKMTPAMAAGVSDTLHDMAWIAGIIDAAAPAPKQRGPYEKKDISN